MRHQDTYIGVALLVCCAIIYWLTTGFPDVPAMLSQNVPPTFFPRLVTGIIALLSTALMVSGFSRPPDAKARIEAPVFTTAAIVLLAGIAVGFIGTFLTLFLIAIAIPVAWGERRSKPIGLLAIGLPGSIYLIFSVVLGIRFPSGRLLEWMA